jgi:hypothetical protein
MREADRLPIHQNVAAATSDQTAVCGSVTDGTPQTALLHTLVMAGFAAELAVHWAQARLVLELQAVQPVTAAVAIAAGAARPVAGVDVATRAGKRSLAAVAGQAGALGRRPVERALPRVGCPRRRSVCRRPVTVHTADAVATCV